MINIKPVQFYFGFDFRAGPEDSVDVTIDASMSGLFWHPHISFLHLLSIKRKEGFGYVDSREYFAYDDHTFFMGEALEITFACNFDFQKFPFDDHTCDFTYFDKLADISKITLNTTDYVAYWENSIESSQNKSLLKITNTTTPYIISVEINPNQTVFKSLSAAGIKIHIQRHSIGLLLGSFYVPTGIFAILSMTSYVINPDIVSFILFSQYSPFDCQVSFYMANDVLLRFGMYFVCFIFENLKKTLCH